MQLRGHTIYEVDTIHITSNTFSGFISIGTGRGEETIKQFIRNCSFLMNNNYDSPT